MYIWEPIAVNLDEAVACLRPSPGGGKTIRTRVNYPGEAGHARYGERIYIGYRDAEKLKIAPLFPRALAQAHCSSTRPSVRPATR
jgi:hypothetical protein